MTAWVPLISCGTMRLTSSMGMVKPMPANVPDGLRMAVFMPISRPELSRSGPPEFSGLMGALVWITPRMGRLLGEVILRPRALTTPMVSVWSRPYGLPMA